MVKIFTLIMILIRFATAYAEDGQWLVSISIGDNLSDKQTIALQNVVGFSFSRLRGNYQIKSQIDDRETSIGRKQFDSQFYQLSSEVAQFKEKNPGGKVSIIMSIIAHGSIRDGSFDLGMTSPDQSAGSVELGHLLNAVGADNLLLILNSCHGGGLVCDIQSPQYPLHTMIEDLKASNRRLQIVTPVYKDLSVVVFDWEKIVLKSYLDSSFNLNQDDIISYYEWKAALLKSAYSDSRFLPEDLYHEMKELKKFYSDGIDPQFFETSTSDFNLLLTPDGAKKKQKGEALNIKASDRPYIDKLFQEVDKVRKEETQHLKDLLQLDLSGLEQRIAGDSSPKTIARVLRILFSIQHPNNEDKFHLMTKLYKIAKTSMDRSNILSMFIDSKNSSMVKNAGQFTSYLEQQVFNITNETELINTVSFLSFNSQRVIPLFKDLSSRAKSVKGRFLAWNILAKYDPAFNPLDLVPVIKNDPSPSLRAGLIDILTERKSVLPELKKLMLNLLENEAQPIVKISTLKYLNKTSSESVTDKVVITHFLNFLKGDKIDSKVKSQFLDLLFDIDTELSQNFLFEYLKLETNSNIQKTIAMYLLYTDSYPQVFAFVKSIPNWDDARAYISIISRMKIPGIIQFLQEMVPLAPNPGEQHMILQMISMLSGSRPCNSYLSR